MKVRLWPMWISAWLVLVAAVGQAAPLSNGDLVPSKTFEDQHGQSRTFPGEARWILFAADKAGGEMSAKTLADLDAEAMRAVGLVYLLDISAMPSLISRMFVMPGLRERDYSILVVRESGKTDFLPYEPERATLIGLCEEGSIRSIAFHSEPAQLREALGLAPLAP